MATLWGRCFSTLSKSSPGPIRPQVELSYRVVAPSQQPARSMQNLLSSMGYEGAAGKIGTALTLLRVGGDGVSRRSART